MHGCVALSWAWTSDPIESRASEDLKDVSRPRVSLAKGFTDPSMRPRYIIWTSVIVLVLAALVIVALGVTSTRWFCSDGCHKVQDDTILAYQHSSHSEISCMSCHMPVGANPIIFVLHKAEALGELYQTLTNQFELPLNGESEVGLTMPSAQCTQCHDLTKRKVTPAAGILIDHKAHSDAQVTCAMCHNRVAHKEDFELKLTDPKTGDKNRKHENFMTMTACFRCHNQSGGGNPPGRCSACHPADFQLKPPSHLQDGFFPTGHGKLATAEAKRVAEARKEMPAKSMQTYAQLVAAQRQEGAKGESIGPLLTKTETLNYCNTCHAEKFCVDCHGGVVMPHPAAFKKSHGDIGKKNPQTCAKCHGAANLFCNQCHHGKSLGWTYDPNTPWLKQHPQAVRGQGAESCFKCHAPTYCANCHVNGPGK